MAENHLRESSLVLFPLHARRPRQWKLQTSSSTYGKNRKNLGSESLSQRPLHNRASPKWVRPNSRPQILTKAIDNHQNNQIVIQPSDKETSNHPWIPPQRQSMKWNKHSQQKNGLEISSTDLIVYDPAPSALNTLIHQSTHDDINASNPPLQQSHCHISENNHSDIVPKEETLADISSNKSDFVHGNEKKFLAVLSLKCMHR